MVIQTSPTDAHWNYFLAIENELIQLARYIEFDAKNFTCFSIEIARILLSSAAEVDVVCKRICKGIDPSTSADNIIQYQSEVTKAYPDFANFEISVSLYGMVLKPWTNWNNQNTPPDWWTAYNKVKHHRDTEYHQANLQNALNSVAGLLVALLYLYKDKATKGDLWPLPVLLRADGKHIGGVVQNMQTLRSGFTYKL